ncbi:MAG: hypothetical protein Roseis2KO_59470 [Roseivirga sp.]
MKIKFYVFEHTIRLGLNDFGKDEMPEALKPMLENPPVEEGTEENFEPQGPLRPLFLSIYEQYLLLLKFTRKFRKR